MTVSATSWLTLRAKFVYRVIDERVGSGDLPLLSVSSRLGVVRRDQLTDDEPRADDLSNYKVCRQGDLVINRMSAYQGALGMARESGIVSPDYLVVRAASDADPRFLHHLFRSRWFVGQMTSRLRGIGGTEQGNVRTPRINAEDLGEILVRLPPIAEQSRVAAHLDLETARIDALIEKKQQMITRLEQRVEASIDMSLNRLLSVGVPLAPLKRLVDPSRPITYGIVQAGEHVDDGVPYIRPVDMVNHEGVPDASRLPRTSPEIAEAYARAEVREGDAIVTIGPSFGKTMIVPANLAGANLTQGTARVAPAPGVNARYLTWALRGRRAISYWESVVGGATFRALNLEPLSRTPVPFLDAASQARVVDELDQVEAIVRRTVDLVRAQVDLLIEHRQALITAAVTGELDLGAAA